MKRLEFEKVLDDLLDVLEPRMAAYTLVTACKDMLISM